MQIPVYHVIPQMEEEVCIIKICNSSRSLIAKLSIPSTNSKEHQEILKTSPLIIEPVYGAQVAINGIHGVNYEAKPDIKYEEIKVKFPDGEVATLLKPSYELIRVTVWRTS